MGWEGNNKEQGRITLEVVGFVAAFDGLAKTAVSQRGTVPTWEVLCLEIQGATIAIIART